MSKSPFSYSGINLYKLFNMRYTFLMLLVPLFWLTSCSNSPETYIASADSVTLAHDVSTLTSPSRKIIRTADIRCRVNNVYDAAAKLEDITRSLDGIVADSRLNNNIMSSKTLFYKADSQKQVQTYTGTARLTLRVPSFYLDTLMKQIAPLANFLDARNLRQQDVTLQYLSNAMHNEAAGVAPPVIVAKAGSNELVKNPKKTKIDSAQKDVVIDRRVENLQLLDDANYATITVELYQPDMVDVLVKADPEFMANIPFSTRLGQALSAGWSYLQGMVLFIIQLWPLWILVAVIFILYKRGWRWLSVIGR